MKSYRTYLNVGRQLVMKYSADSLDLQLELDLYSLHCSGFIVIKDFVSRSLLNLISKDTVKFESEVIEYKKNGGNVSHQHNWPLLTTRCLYTVSNELQKIACSNSLLQLVEGYLGSFILRDCLMQTLLPDPKNKKRGKDADLSFHRDTLWQNNVITPMYLHAFLLLDDMTDKNGATVVVPGSHLRREPNYYFKNNDIRSRQPGIDYKVYERRYFASASPIIAQAGSLVLLDPMMIHTQGNNITDRPRRLINMPFRSRTVKPVPPLLNAHKIAIDHSRVKLEDSFLKIIESDSSLPSIFGPLN